MPPKRRRKLHGLYYHSSPPKVMPMSNAMKARAQDNGKEAIVIKPSNIRIWIHDKDMSKLSRVLWEGQGNRLRTEVSSNRDVKRFLEAVPYVMNIIKDIHSSVVDNDIELLMAKTANLPAVLLSSKDTNGLTALHKAAGLAHTRIVEYLLAAWPDAATDLDFTGKTPLHWAASAKNNSRAYNVLVQAGSDEQSMDYKMKTATYYKNKPNDIDRSLLTVVPDAPRVPQQGLPAAYDWSMFIDESSKDLQTNNNYLRKSQSNYESYSILSDVPPPSHLKRHGSSEILRNSNSVSPVLARISRQSMDNINLAGDNETPLTTEEQAVLVAINPENELLYRNTSAVRPDTPDVSDTENADRMDASDGDDPVPMTEQIDHESSHTNHIVLDNDAELADDELNAGSNDDDNDNDDGDCNGGYNSDTEPKVNDENEVGKESDTDAIETSNGTEKQEPIPTENLEAAKDPDDFDQDNNTEKAEEAIESTDDQADADVAEFDEDNGSTTPDEGNVVDEANDETDENTMKDIDQTDEENGDEDLNVHDENADAAVIDSPENGLLDDDDDDGHLEDEQNVLENELVDNMDANAIEPELSDDLVNNGTEANEREIEADDADEATETELEQEIVNEEQLATEQDDDDDDDGGSGGGGDGSDRGGVVGGSGVGSKDEVSPSPALEIEGVVRGEAENGLVQSEGSNFMADADDTEETTIKNIINSGDMEQLASLVLNGEGRKLIALQSDQPEIQAFLDNVPAYMNKIRRVHLAAREGNLRDLQSALDRRKFAVAKDEISPNGATPLHVAAVFGHAGVMRYLAGRFPETTSATDRNGRTALHYAATLQDNGHFFNLLTHLGANPKADDNMGKSAEFYMNHEQSDTLLSHRKILKEFGAQEELADDMLSDQDLVSGGPQNQVEIPLFRTEEGRYLATTLGDPLIKGLTEVANNRPTDPIAFLANYLHGFAKEKKMNANEAIRADPIGIEDDEDIDELGQQLQQQQIDEVESEQISDHSEEATVDDSPELAQTSDDRDEHGQSLLHFACARSHPRNALIQLIEESDVSITYRDELYRTARDVCYQASQPDNAKEIDRYILGHAARGDIEFFEKLLLEGYDHITDIIDTDNSSIVQVAQSRGHDNVVKFLQDVAEFEENREKLHRAIRANEMNEIKLLLSRSESGRLAKAKNYYGRCSAHVAILRENEEIVDYITTKFKQTLRIGDNLDRTPLHYAMAVNNVEALSRILIRNRAKRVLKDLKGRQPSYYFMNKADIIRLKEEEEDDHD